MTVIFLRTYTLCSEFRHQTFFKWFCGISLPRFTPHMSCARWERKFSLTF